MEITRRRFLAGSVALTGAALVGGAAAAGPETFLAWTGSAFCHYHVPIHPTWHALCVTSSVWHIDNASYGETLIRHQMTNLAFLIREDGDALKALQIHSRCWQGNEAADPDRVVGLAALLIAEDARRSPIWVEAAEKPLFVSYRRARRTPGVFTHVSEAPPISLTLLGSSWNPFQNAP